VVLLVVQPPKPLQKNMRGTGMGGGASMVSCTQLPAQLAAAVVTKKGTLMSPTGDLSLCRKGACRGHRLAK
jgi:hypothetical protein